jgi:hypothetical protein
MARYVLLVTRWDWVEADVDLEYTVIGPFRSRERAEHRARVIRKLAKTYDDPEGVTGPENALSVTVLPIAPGPTSAQGAMDLLYGSVVIE